MCHEQNYGEISIYCYIFHIPYFLLSIHVSPEIGTVTMPLSALSPRCLLTDPLINLTLILLGSHQNSPIVKSMINSYLIPTAVNF